MKYTGHINENVAPYAAHKIGVYNSSNIRVGEIPLGNFKPEYGERLYRFGIMSDMHYNDTDDNNIIQDDGSNYHYDLICALKYFNEKEDVSFICAAGDVSTNYITQVKIYHDAIQDNYPSQLIYTCKGNHDNQASYNNDALWKQYTFPSNNPFTTYFFKESDPTNLNVTTSSNSNSFYFLKPLESDPTKQDVFVFFSVDYASNSATSNGSRYYSPESITWLSTLLERYKNNRVFLFTHLFFWKKAGNCNEYYYPGNHSSQYVLFGDQYTTLNNLNNQYKNVIWFTGHSHYKWDYQPEDTRGSNGPQKRCNVCNYDQSASQYCAYNVHIPSLARPLLNSASYSVDQLAAQCGVVDVYEDCVVVRGIDMTNSTSGDYTYTVKYLPIAQYKLPVTIDGVNNAINNSTSPEVPDTPEQKNLLTTSWIQGYGVSSSTGNLESKAFATVTDYIEVNSNNTYYLTANNIRTSTNTNGLWCIAIYAYDNNKQFIGRIAGSSRQTTRASGNVVYFDAINNGVWESSYENFDITNYIFANSNTAYIRVKYEFDSVLDYATLLPNSISNNEVKLETNNN